ncbi:hypothetical protein NRIC_09890 [Enterococcus florum]|uniref:Uncharacterized protein n=1 Tax=Enterococcus florum TaxID=2480627 RepID=A0A4P5PAT9_9ENTE|nr:hypothetical protein [Enterococcus florum]GCF93098.1 hypothetical protein NRIC_09890 [Enterococcus florum]
MFHLMLILLPLLFLVMILSILLFGATMLLISLFGGAATVLWIKNRTAKRLLFIGFAIVSLIGGMCLFPFVGIYANLTMPLFRTITGILLSLIVFLAMGGIKISMTVQNKTGRTFLCILYALAGGGGSSFIGDFFLFAEIGSWKDSMGHLDCQQLLQQV